MHKIVLNNGFETFNDFILNIQSNFHDNSQSIHKARNELKILQHNDSNTIVKSFKVPNILRKIIYTYFRDSKAKKSYDNSLRLQHLTPKPIGYIEFFKNALIDDSYFISEQFEYDFTIREPLLDDNFEKKEEILQTFSHFTYELHQNNILHLDYSPGNILIKKEPNGFVFKVVDVNRMEFRELSLEDRLKNFNKLWANNAEITTIAREYAKICNEDEDKCIEIALHHKTKHKNKMRLKKRLKGQKLVD